MKNIETIVLKDSQNRYNEEYGKTGVAHRVTNLRERDDSLTGVCSKKHLFYLPEGMKLVIADKRSDRTNYIVSYNSKLMLYATQIEDGDCTVINSVIGNVDGEVINCVAIGDFVVAYTNKAKTLVHFDGENYHLVNIDDSLPLLILSAGETTSQSANIPAVTFSKGYLHWTPPLADTDVAQVRKALKNVHTELENRNKRMGRFVQPIVARYVVRLWDETIIHVSPPVIVGNGLQPAKGVSMDVVQNSSGFVGTSECKYSLQSFGLAITTLRGIDASWDALIKSVEIYYCDIDNVTDFDTLDYICETTQTGTRKYYLTASLGTLGGTAVGTRLVNAKCWKMIACITDMEALRNGKVISAGVAKCNNTSGGEFQGKTYVAYDGGLYNKSLSNDEITNAIWNRCRTMIPTVAVEHGGKLYEGGGKAKLHNCWRPELFFSSSVSANSGNVYVAINVRSNDGVRKVVNSYYCDNISMELSPLISFPFANATEAEIVISSQGKVYRWKETLRSANGCEMSYSVNSDLKSYKLTSSANDTIIVLPEENAVERLNNRLKSYYILNPISSDKCQIVGNGDILAVAFALHPVTANIFGRFPLYVFGKDGIFAVSTEKEDLQPRCIDKRGVTSQKLVAQCSDGIRMMSNNNLLLLDGTKLTLMERDVECEQLAWDDINKELITLNKTNVEIYNIDGRHYERSEKIDYIIGNRYAIGIDNSVVDINTEINENTEVYFLSHPWLTLRKVKGVEWNIFGDNMNLTMTIRGSNGDTCHGAILSQIKINGRLDAPLKLPLKLPYFRVLRIEISGTMPHGVLLRGVKIEYA